MREMCGSLRGAIADADDVDEAEIAGQPLREEALLDRRE